MKSKRLPPFASSPHDTFPVTFYYKGNRFTLTPPTKAMPFYTIKNLCVLSGPLLEIPGTYKGTPIRRVNLLDISPLSRKEEIQEILLPNEIRILGTEVDPFSHIDPMMPTRTYSPDRPIVLDGIPLPALKAITPSKNHHYFVSVDGILYSKDKKKLVMCPWGNGLKEFHIPEGTERIGNYAFIAHPTLTEVHLPSTLTAIEPGAFSACTSLKGFYYSDPSQLSLIDEVGHSGRSVYLL